MASRVVNHDGLNNRGIGDPRTASCAPCHRRWGIRGVDTRTQAIVPRRREGSDYPAHEKPPLGYVPDKTIHGRKGQRALSAMKLRLSGAKRRGADPPEGDPTSIGESHEGD